MEHLPKRTSLVIETASTLKEWIAAGFLRDILPGELQLKSRLRVGRDTLRLALKSLAHEGWVTPSSKGRQRWVNTGHPLLAADTNVTKLPATFISPKPVETMCTFLEMEDTRIRLAEQGCQVRYVSPALFHLKHPEFHLERFVRANPSCAWILYMATDAMQRWFERQGLPAFIYGSPFPGVGLPYVVSNWEEAAFHAGIQLIRHGHRTIGIMEYHVQFPGVLREERGLERALEVLKGQGRLLRFKDDRTPDSIAKSLELAFSMRQRPTALVFTYTSQLLTCYSWMVSKGLRVPGDVSMVSMANDSWFDDLHPRLCYYRPDKQLMSRSIADRVLELVETGRVTKESAHIRLEYVSGTTIGPPPNPDEKSRHAA
ncbi:MAG TPA: substrate-binding domain-containing protein [Candidatus Sulfotelmatobacter sp.]|nr:substrate-binding domain-containing protein [Candidatus Sulfotelmatobacter sp.]